VTPNRHEAWHSSQPSTFLIPDYPLSLGRGLRGQTTVLVR